MIDLCISGTLDKEVIHFSLEGNSQTIDQFSKEIHFFLEENKTYRIYFKQKAEQYIPRYAEIALNVLLLPIKGIFNVVTFNIDQNWEEDISAFRISGYIEVSLYKDTEILFEFKKGKYDKIKSQFQSPRISFVPDVLIEQSITLDTKEISKKHCVHLENIASASVLLFALLCYLLFIASKNGIYAAFICTFFFLIIFGVIVGFLVFRSFKKKRDLVTILLNQQRKN